MVTRSHSRQPAATVSIALDRVGECARQRDHNEEDNEVEETKRARVARFVGVDRSAVA